MRDSDEGQERSGREEREKRMKDGGMEEMEKGVSEAVWRNE